MSSRTMRVKARKRRPSIRNFLARLGPGLIAGASDDDPSGIATYSQSGSRFGYSLLWTMPFSYPLMIAIQEISARIGGRTADACARPRAVSGGWPRSQVRSAVLGGALRAGSRVPSSSAMASQLGVARRPSFPRMSTCWPKATSRAAGVPEVHRERPYRPLFTAASCAARKGAGCARLRRKPFPSSSDRRSRAMLGRWRIATQPP
jgi:hypothetical protein